MAHAGHYSDVACFDLDSSLTVAALVLSSTSCHKLPLFVMVAVVIDCGDRTESNYRLSCCCSRPCFWSDIVD